MIQLAAPTRDGPVGLIWLDEFPYHGKTFLNIPDEYKSLLDVLNDPDILKVGVSASMDAMHLASWWGITDREYVGDFFQGVVDLERQRDTDVQDFRLDEMCAHVLRRDLPKRKARKGDEKISHWRANELTEKMKEYAAHDASCAIDIWMNMQGFIHDNKKT